MNHAPLPFTNPFGKNGCGPLAFALAGGLDADGARLLAMYAEEKGLFWPKNKASRSRSERDFDFWAGLAGIAVVRRVPFNHVSEYVDTGGRWRTRTARPTLQRFLSAEGSSGRWLVYTAHHVQYVEDGTVFGYHLMRSRVQLAVEIRKA